jgi:hypothetical protein
MKALISTAENYPSTHWIHYRKTMYKNTPLFTGEIATPIEVMPVSCQVEQQQRVNIR